MVASVFTAKFDAVSVPVMVESDDDLNPATDSEPPIVDPFDTIKLPLIVELFVVCIPVTVNSPATVEFAVELYPPTFKVPPIARSPDTVEFAETRIDPPTVTPLDIFRPPVMLELAVDLNPLIEREPDIVESDDTDKPPDMVEFAYDENPETANPPAIVSLPFTRNEPPTVASATEFKPPATIRLPDMV
jgi:hypothetical protein